MRKDIEKKEWICRAIADFMAGPDNDLHMAGGPEPAFAAPLTGFAAGDDRLWEEYKEYVGGFHWTPREAFCRAFPDENPAPEELTVVVWVLPQTPATRRDHRKENTLPAERWARARIMGENFVNNGLRRHVASLLSLAGIQSVAPMLIKGWERKESERYGYASTWSERHAAYAAGLGTFGLCDGLITPAGKAMRVGSVIIRAKLPPSPRLYSSHREYCLFFNSGTCGVCIKRCPVGALSREGHDKRLCRDYLQQITAPYVKEAYRFDGYGCGLCQVGVPCESGIPPHRPAVRREAR
jgi:epoxyqueuosine reductase QueG